MGRKPVRVVENYNTELVVNDPVRLHIDWRELDRLERQVRARKGIVARRIPLYSIVKNAGVHSHVSDFIPRGIGGIEIVDKFVSYFRNNGLIVTRGDILMTSAEFNALVAARNKYALDNTDVDLSAQ